MRNKKVYNNIFDSICITVLFAVCLASYFMIILFGVINHTAGTNPFALMIFSTLFFGAMITIIAVLIIKECYGYWFLSENEICGKKLFRKKVSIKINEIERVEKKIVPALVLGTYKSEAYIIHSKDKKIVVLIDEKRKFSDLDFELVKFISK